MCNEDKGFEERERGRGRSKRREGRRSMGLELEVVEKEELREVIGLEVLGVRGWEVGEGILSKGCEGI